jgi:hypothetical protein
MSPYGNRDGASRQASSIKTASTSALLQGRCAAPCQRAWAWAWAWAWACLREGLGGSWRDSMALCWRLACMRVRGDDGWGGA